MKYGMEWNHVERAFMWCDKSAWNRGLLTRVTADEFGGQTGQMVR